MANLQILTGPPALPPTPLPPSPVLIGIQPGNDKTINLTQDSLGPSYATLQSGAETYSALVSAVQCSAVHYSAV